MFLELKNILSKNVFSNIKVFLKLNIYQEKKLYILKLPNNIRRLYGTAGLVVWGFNRFKASEPWPRDS